MNSQEIEPKYVIKDKYCNQISLTPERRPSDQNSSKHENSYSELGGPVFAPKFGKLTLKKKRSADNVKNKKIS